jgi:hypothetical protein
LEKIFRVGICAQSETMANSSEANGTPNPGNLNNAKMQRTARAQGQKIRWQLE